MAVINPEICPNSDVQFLQSVKNQQPQVINYYQHYNLHLKTPLEQCNQNYDEMKKLKRNMQESAKQQDLQMRWWNLRKLPMQFLKPNLWETNFNPYCTHIGRAVSYLQSGSNLHGIGCAHTLATTLCASFHGRIIVDCGRNGWQEPAILRSIQCGESGIGKTTVHSRAMQPFYEYENTYNINHNVAKPLEKELILEAYKKEKKKLVQEIDIYAQDSMEKIRQIVSKLEDSPLFDRMRSQRLTLVITSAKTYGIRNILARNGGAVFLSNSEGNSLKEILSSDSNDIAAKSYNQESETYLYRNKEITIPFPSIVMLISLQPAMLLDIYHGKKSKRLHESGLTARFLPFIHPNKGMLIKQDNNWVSSAFQKEYNGRITELLNLFCTTDQYAQKYSIRLSDSAQKLLFNFLEQCNASLYKDEMRYWIAKAPGHAVRVAAAYHFWRHGENGIYREICEEDFRLAIATVQSTMQHAQYLYDPYGMQAEQTAERIITSLQHIPDNIQIGYILQNGLTTRDIQQRTKIDRLAINNAFYRMQQGNWAAVWDDGSGNLTILFRHEIFGWQYTDTPYAGVNNLQLIPGQLYGTLPYGMGNLL